MSSLTTTAEELITINDANGHDITTTNNDEDSTGGIATPHDHDVLSGRGNTVNRHPGNEYVAMDSYSSYNASSNMTNAEDIGNNNNKSRNKRKNRDENNKNRDENNNNNDSWKRVRTVSLEKSDETATNENSNRLALLSSVVVPMMASEEVKQQQEEEEEQEQPPLSKSKCCSSSSTIMNPLIQPQQHLHQQQKYHGDGEGILGKGRTF